MERTAGKKMAENIPPIDEQFAQRLPDDPRRALCEIVETFSTLCSVAHPASREVDTAFLKEYLSLYALAELVLNRAEITDIEKPDLNCESWMAMQRIENYFATLHSITDPIIHQVMLDEQMDKLGRSLSITHFYEFSDRDVLRIQELVNELRDLVVSSTHFEEDHKRRLLKRLERLQTELHKKMSDLDRFWGLIGDAGVAVGKFGKDAKPFVDRIRELGEIVWRAQAEAEKLPKGADFPLLADKGNKAT